MDINYRVDYLEPKFENVKSYYKKAHVTYIFGVYTLYSYATKVIELKQRGDTDYVTFYAINHYSRTTLRHIREFAKQFGNQRFADFVNLSKSRMLYLLGEEAEGKEFRFSKKPDAIDSSGRVETYYIH